MYFQEKQTNFWCMIIMNTESSIELERRVSFIVTTPAALLSQSSQIALHFLEKTCRDSFFSARWRGVVFIESQTFNHKGVALLKVNRDI